VDLLDIGALVLGAIVAVMLALFAGSGAKPADASMVWEGRVAVGFTSLLVIGPFWLSQGAVTIAATSADGGLGPAWLWAWFIAAPPLGLSPPAGRAVRALHRAVGRRPTAAYAQRGVAAVQQEANFAWAATDAEDGWELRRTPPLPASWPPVAGGPAVWLCYAERAGTPQIFEVAGPWARITLSAGESAWPVVERLSDEVESLGVQAVRPLDPDRDLGPKASHLDLMGRGDDVELAKALREWRSHNGLLAAHPAATGHLPPS
jgi:hypothetical protein